MLEKASPFKENSKDYILLLGRIFQRVRIPQYIAQIEDYTVIKFLLPGLDYNVL